PTLADNEARGLTIKGGLHSVVNTLKQQFLIPENCAPVRSFLPAVPSLRITRPFRNLSVPLVLALLQVASLPLELFILSVSVVRFSCTSGAGYHNGPPGVMLRWTGVARRYGTAHQRWPTALGGMLTYQRFGGGGTGKMLLQVGFGGGNDSQWRRHSKVKMLTLL
ncbi:hypothetical protein Tco_0275951, partial [Tanacetum coccineum]